MQGLALHARVRAPCHGVLSSRSTAYASQPFEACIRVCACEGKFTKNLPLIGARAPGSSATWRRCWRRATTFTRCPTSSRATPCWTRWMPTCARSSALLPRPPRPPSARPPRPAPPCACQGRRGVQSPAALLVQMGMHGSVYATACCVPAVHAQGLLACSLAALPRPALPRKPLGYPRSMHGIARGTMPATDHQEHAARHGRRARLP